MAFDGFNVQGREGDGGEAGDYDADDNMLGEAGDGSVDEAGWMEGWGLERMKFDGDDVVDRGGSITTTWKPRNLILGRKTGTLKSARQNPTAGNSHIALYPITIPQNVY